jgi:hypothetical protein
MTQEGIKITLLTVEKLGLVKRVCKIFNSRVTFEEIRVIKKGQLSPGDDGILYIKSRWCSRENTKPIGFILVVVVDIHFEGFS